jgi:hypothetical protein
MTTHNLHVSIRRWFQPTYGNTYHTVRVWIDGGEPLTSGRTYGYGDHYWHTLGELLADHTELARLLPAVRSAYDVSARAMREAGHTVTVEVADVKRRKDLHTV